MTMDASGGDDEALTPDQTVRLTIEGRYGPRVVLTTRLRGGLRWAEAAPVTPTEDATVVMRIARRLEESVAPLTAEQLAGDIGAALKAVQNALPTLVKGGRVRRSGSGRRGDPFVYGPPPILPPRPPPIPRPGGNDCDEAAGRVQWEARLTGPARVTLLPVPGPTAGPSRPRARRRRAPGGTPRAPATGST